MDSISKKTVIPCIYDSADSFYFFNRATVGIFVHKLHNYYFERGVIDTLGNIIIPIKYEDIYYYSGEYFRVVYYDEGEEREKEGVFDCRGKEIIPPIYRDIEIKEDIFAVTRTYDGDNDFYGCYNLNLKKEILPCKYKEITVLNKQLISVLSDGKYTYYNQEGKPLPPFRADFADSDGFLDFRKAQMRPNEAIWDVDSLDIAYAKCIAIYDGMLVYGCDNDNSDNSYLSRLFKGKNRILNEIKKVSIACVLDQKIEGGGIASETFNLYQDVIDKNRDIIDKEYEDINDLPLVECKIMVITYYKNGKSRDEYYITSMKKTNKK